MASFQCTGFISNISYRQGFCFVFLSEFKKGYKKKDGSRVEDKNLIWKCIFKQGLVKYISDHFSSGMLVEVKGEVLPYAIEQGNVVEGSYSVIGQCINIASFPRSSVQHEMKMIKESEMNSEDKPDIESYMQPDF